MRNLVIVQYCDPHHFFGQGTKVPGETHDLAIDGSEIYEIEFCPDCYASMLEPLKKLMALTNNVKAKTRKGPRMASPVSVDIAQLTASTDRSAAAPLPTPALAPALTQPPAPSSGASTLPPGDPEASVVAEAVAAAEARKQALGREASPPKPNGANRARTQRQLEPRYPCILCPPGENNPSVTYYKADRHMALVHRMPIKGIYGTRCFVCGEEKGSVTGLNAHFGQHLTQGGPFHSMPEGFLYVRDTLGDPQGLCAARMEAIRSEQAIAVAEGPGAYQGVNYPCPLCPKGVGFDTKDKLAWHLGRDHNTKSGEVYGLTCHLDGYVGADSKRLRGHFASLHSKQFPSLMATMVWARDNGDRLGTVARALAHLARQGTVTGVNLDGTGSVGVAAGNVDQPRLAGV